MVLQITSFFAEIFAEFAGIKFAFAGVSLLVNGMFLYQKLIQRGTKQFQTKKNFITFCKASLSKFVDFALTNTARSRIFRT